MNDMEQGSDGWFAARLGRVTASRIADVVAKTKSGYSASRANYAAQLIAERLTGSRAETYSNAAMQHGTEMEPVARRAYEMHAGEFVEQVGFVPHPTIEMAGASPDGLVGDDGLVEIKCPNTATHIDTLLGAPIPLKYQLQMLWQMACTGRQWCDFVSFDDRMPEPMRLHVQRFECDASRIAEVEAEVRTFLAEVADKVARLSALQLKESA